MSPRAEHENHLHSCHEQQQLKAVAYHCHYDCCLSPVVQGHIQQYSTYIASSLHIFIVRVLPQTTTSNEVEVYRGLEIPYVSITNDTNSYFKPLIMHNTKYIRVLATNNCTLYISPCCPKWLYLPWKGSNLLLELYEPLKGLLQFSIRETAFNEMRSSIPGSVNVFTPTSLGDT